MVPPVSPPGRFIVQRSLKALFAIEALGAVMFVEPAGSST
jgi:hypothetical protein